MYEVKWNDTAGRGCVEEVKDLSEAMAFAKELGILVTINGGGMEIVGVFGADSINNGLLPNGDKYSWYKRRRPWKEAAVKIVKLDRRHNLFHKGYSHAFVVNRWTADTNRLEKAVKELEGYRWDSTFWGKAPKYGTRPFYIGVKNESTLTLALLKL